MIVDVLRTRYFMMTPKEKIFAEGIVKFHESQGYLSEKQFKWARKFALRLILERDKFFL